MCFTARSDRVTKWNETDAKWLIPKPLYLTVFTKGNADTQNSSTNAQMQVYIQQFSR